MNYDLFLAHHYLDKHQLIKVSDNFYKCDCGACFWWMKPYPPAYESSRYCAGAEWSEIISAALKDKFFASVNWNDHVLRVVLDYKKNAKQKPIWYP
jgi:hypothetical protein